MGTYSINATHLKLATALGLLGFVLNLFPIPLFANVQLVLGNTAVVIIAKLLGPWYALLTSVFTASGLMLVWDSPHVYLIFLLEALWLGFARRKDVHMLYASIGYWLLIGLPLMVLYLWFITGMSVGQIPFIAAKQAINGIFYTSLGELCVLATPPLWRLKGKLINHSRRSFSTQLSYLFILITTVSLLASSMSFNHFSISRQQELKNRNLNDTGIFLSHATDAYIRSNMQTIVNLGNVINVSDMQPEQWQDILTSTQSLTPSCITLFITNENGDVIAGSPLERLQKIEDQESAFINVKDRDYFIASFEHKRTFVSPVFIGRGLKKAKIVALSTPLYKGRSSKPVGVVVCSLDLDYFSSIDKQNRHHTSQSVILLDDKNNIVYASDNLELNPFTPFNFTTGNPEYKTKLKLMNISPDNTGTPEYIYTLHELKNSWHLYVVEPFVPLLKRAQEQYTHTVILLILSMIAAVIIARAISRLTTTPLSLLAKHFSQDKYSNIDQAAFSQELLDLDNNTPTEIFSLYDSLETSRLALLNNQLELEEKVKQRTQDLEIANLRLKDMAERDALTNLYNRRYTEKQFLHIQDLCERSQDAIAVVLLDLDFFKKVNDTYGHLAGDECLRVMAAILSAHFKRDVDLLCRYGGEEFVLVLPMCNTLKVEKHLNDFREKLAQTVITDPANKVTFNVTVSIGALIADASFNSSLETWLKQADDNLYKAKELGRNRVVCTLINPE